MTARVLLLSTLLGCVPSEPTTPAPRTSTPHVSLAPLEGCGAGRVLGHTRLDGAPATLLAIGAHRVLVRDDLGGVAVSEPGPTIVATAEVEGGWIFELADGSFATSSEPLGALTPFVVDVPERETTWFVDPSAPPRIHRGVLAVVRRDRVYEIDLTGARTIETEWPVTDVLALGGAERLVGLVGGGLLRGPWDALRPVPLRSPWRDWRVHIGRVAVRAGPEWVDLDDAPLAPRPSRCLLRAKPRAARERVLLELFDRDLRESPSEPTLVIQRRSVRRDGAESIVLGGTMFRRAADGALSAISLRWRDARTGERVAPEDACEPLEGDDTGWWLQCGWILLRVGDDDRLVPYRHPPQLRRVVGWWGTCDGPERPEPYHAEGQQACVMDGSGAPREIRLLGTPIARCGSTLYTTSSGRTHAQSLVDGSSREIPIEAHSYGVCLPNDGIALRSRENLVIWRDEPVVHDVPLEHGGLYASGAGELAISEDGHVAFSTDEGDTWRVGELEPDDELRCGARCEVVSAHGRRALGELSVPAGDPPRAQRGLGSFPGRTNVDRPPRAPTLRCTTSPTIERTRVEEDELQVLHDGRFRRVPLERRDPDVLWLDDHEVVVDDGGRLVRVTLGRRLRRVPLARPPGRDASACMGCGTWLSGQIASTDPSGRLVILSTMCESELVRYEEDGEVAAVRRFVPAAHLAFHEGETFAAFTVLPWDSWLDELDDEDGTDEGVDEEASRVIAYPMDPSRPPLLWSVPRTRRVCRDGERGEWTWFSHESFEGDGIFMSAVLEVTGGDACIAELRSGEHRLIAEGGRLVGVTRTRAGWVEASCEPIE